MTAADLAHVLVDRDWVVRHAKDPTVRFVEVDVDTAAYDSGHIPGAVGWNWRTELQDPLRRDVAGATAFEQLLGDAGIGPDTTVVLYGDNNNWFAAYGAWLLRYYGHPSVKLMDGGRARWIAEGRPLTTERPRVPPATYRIGVPNRALRALREDVRRIVEAPAGTTALVDVRSEAEYSGELLAPPGLAETAQRAGHIPGAANVPWSRAVRDDGTLKSHEELFVMYRSLGVIPERPVVTYCRIGERSAHTWFVLHEVLAYPDVRNYDGSWTEWGSLIDVPIERGARVLIRAGACAE